MRRGPGLVAPAILVAVGVVALLANVGVVSSAGLEKLANLWPLILVVLGIELVLRGVTDPVTAGRVGLVVVALAAGAAVAYATLAPAQPAGEHTADFTAPAGGLEHAQLVLLFGGADISMRMTDAGDSALYNAHVSYSGNQHVTANFDRSSGTVTLILASRGIHFGGGHTQMDVTLNRSVSWSVTVSGGATKTRLDLAGGHLAALDISGGASSSDVVLPPPAGTVTLSFSGGANTVSIHRPAGTGTRVEVSGGASSLQGDGTSRSGVGDISWQSDGYDSAQNHYAVTVSGGANHVVVDTRG